MLRTGALYAGAVSCWFLSFVSSLLDTVGVLSIHGANFWGLVLAGGVFGTVMLATDLLTGPTLEELKEKASRAQRDYDDLLTLQREKEANFTRVKSLCSHLLRCSLL